MTLCPYATSYPIRNYVLSTGVYLDYLIGREEARARTCYLIPSDRYETTTPEQSLLMGLTHVRISTSPSHITDRKNVNELP